MRNFTFSYNGNWETIYFTAGKDKWSGNTEGYVKKYCLSTYGSSSECNPIGIYLSIDSESDRKQFDLCFEQFITNIKNSDQLSK